jgi:hypothetical protein
VWVRNPLHVLFIFTFCILLTFSTFTLGRNVYLLDEILAYYRRIYQTGNFWFSLQLTGMEYGLMLLKDLVWRLFFTFFSLPFVWPLVSTIKRMYILFLVIPFSIIYMPLFSSISIVGAIHFLRKRHLLRTATRAW